MLAPALLAQSLRRHIDRDIRVLLAELQSAIDPAVGTDLEISLDALEGEAVLHLETDRAAECVQSEHRVVGLEVGAVDRIGRDEVEVDRVAERLVETDAVHVDGEALRLARHRRGDEAAIADVGLETVALLVRRAHAGDALEQRVGDVRAIALRKVLGGQGLDQGWDLVPIDASTGERRCRDDLDLGQHCLPERARRPQRGEQTQYAEQSTRGSTSGRTPQHFAQVALRNSRAGDPATAARVADPPPQHQSFGKLPTCPGRTRSAVIRIRPAGSR